VLHRRNLDAVGLVDSDAANFIKNSPATTALYPAAQLGPFSC